MLELRKFDGLQLNSLEVCANGDCGGWCFHPPLSFMIKPMRSVQMLVLHAASPKQVAIFYQDTLGFSIIDKSNDAAVLEGYGLQLMIEKPKPGANTTADLQSFEFDVPIEQLRRIVRTVGGERVPLLDSRGCFAFDVRDPEGHRWTITSPLPTFEPDAENSRKRVQRVD